MKFNRANFFLFVLSWAWFMPKWILKFDWNDWNLAHSLWEKVSGLCSCSSERLWWWVGLFCISHGQLSAIALHAILLDANSGCYGQFNTMCIVLISLSVWRVDATGHEITVLFLLLLVRVGFFTALVPIAEVVSRDKVEYATRYKEGIQKKEK